MNLSEELYILYRTFKAAFSWLIYLMCSLFPIRKNKIVFSAFEGGGYGCNPKYIAEEIIRRMHKDGKPYELVWLVNDTSNIFPPEIKAVKNNLLNRAYHLATAKIWVDNSRKYYGTRKRHGQFYMQTWHGPIGFKPIGAMRGTQLPKIAEIVSRNDSNLIDCFLANSDWQIRTIQKALFYRGQILKSGSPRCDLMFKKQAKQRESFLNKYHLPNNTKIVMYAPTFRAGSQHTNRWVEKGAIGFNFDRLLDVLDSKLDGSWYLILRLHPQVAARFKEFHMATYKTKNVLDLSHYPDAYEILTATDILITDYSSLAFDASYKKIPVFLYAPDMESMKQDRGGLLWDIKNLPFPFAETEEELFYNIAAFDKQQYKCELDKFLKPLHILEDGKASERATDWILYNMKDKRG